MSLIIVDTPAVFLCRGLFHPPVLQFNMQQPHLCSNTYLEHGCGLRRPASIYSRGIAAVITIVMPQHMIQRTVARLTCFVKKARGSSSYKPEPSWERNWLATSYAGIRL